MIIALQLFFVEHSSNNQPTITNRSFYTYNIYGSSWDLMIIYGLCLPVLSDPCKITSEQSATCKFASAVIFNLNQIAQELMKFLSRPQLYKHTFLLCCCIRASCKCIERAFICVTRLICQNKYFIGVNAVQVLLTKFLKNVVVYLQ